MPLLSQHRDVRHGLDDVPEVRSLHGRARHQPRMETQGWALQETRSAPTRRAGYRVVEISRFPPMVMLVYGGRLVGNSRLPHIAGMARLDRGRPALVLALSTTAGWPPLTASCKRLGRRRGKAEGAAQLHSPSVQCDRVDGRRRDVMVLRTLYIDSGRSAGSLEIRLTGNARHANPLRDPD